MSNRKKAVVDRIVDNNKAVLLVGDNEVEHVIDINELPKGIKEGDWLQVQLKGGKIVKIELDEQETEDVKKRIEDKMAKLKKKSGSKFKK